MSRTEFLAELRKPGKVFAKVVLTMDDAFYIAVEKGSVLACVSENPEVEYKAQREEDGLYIG